MSGAAPDPFSDSGVYSEAAEAGSLAEGFQRHMAAKVNPDSGNQANPAARNIDPSVQKVLQVFRGTIVEESNR